MDTPGVVGIIQDQELFILQQETCHSILVSTIIQDGDNLPYALSFPGLDPWVSYRTGN